MWSASLYWKVYLAAAAAIATVFLLQLTDGAVLTCVLLLVLLAFVEG
jgi:hypothetical protein